MPSDQSTLRSSMNWFICITNASYCVGIVYNTLVQKKTLIKLVGKGSNLNVNYHADSNTLFTLISLFSHSLNYSRFCGASSTLLTAISATNICFLKIHYIGPILCLVSSGVSALYLHCRLIIWRLNKDVLQV